jgi:hypothetical protein
MVSKKGTKIEDFNGINVPLGPLRMEIALLQKEGLETMPLGELLRIVARIIKDAKAEM